MAKTKVYFSELAMWLSNQVGKYGEATSTDLTVDAVAVDGNHLIVDISGPGVPDVEHVTRLLGRRIFEIPDGLSLMPGENPSTEEMTEWCSKNRHAD